MAQRQQTLPLPQIKVVLKRNGREQPTAGEPAWRTSRCPPRWGIFIMEFGSHEAAQSWADSMLGLWGDAQFSSASVAFQVMTGAGWPRRWVCAKLHCSVSHTLLPVPGSRDGTQLPCGSRRKHGRAVAQTMGAREYAWPCCQDCLLLGAESPQKYPEVFIAQSHQSETRFVQLSPN